MSEKSKFVFMALPLLLAGQYAMAQGTYYISSSNGKDSNPGSQSQPFASINTCAKKEGAKCIVLRGQYREVVTPKSGVTIEALEKNSVMLDGSDVISGQWDLHKDGIYKIKVALRGDGTDQLFVDDKMMTEARWPNGHNLFAPKWQIAQAGTNTNTLIDSQLPNVNLMGARMMWWSGDNPWSSLTAEINSSSVGTVKFTLDSPGYGDSITPKVDGKYYIVGALGLLDQPREWYYDKSNQMLYFMAPGKANPSQLTVKVKKRDVSVDLIGVNGVTIKNIGLFATTIRINDTSENNTLDGISASYLSHYTKLKQGQNGGPNWMTRTKDTGIQINGKNNSIKNSIISYSAGNGIYVGGTGNKVENNLIRYVNYTGDYTAGITNLSNKPSTFKYNTIYSTGRSAIYSGVGSEISFNNLFNTMLLSKDGGVIYTGGNKFGEKTHIHHNHMHAAQFSFKEYPGDWPYPVSGVYIDYGGTDFTVEQNVFWNLRAYSVVLNGSGIPERDMLHNNNRVVNNSILDGQINSRMQMFGVKTCGTTTVSNNKSIHPPRLHNTTCPAFNNTPEQAGASNMNGNVKVGCDFAGCESPKPPNFNAINKSVAASLARYPLDTVAQEGGSVSFVALAGGTGNVKYQWKKNGVDIPGATSSTYTYNNVALADNGAKFTIYVSNDLGNATSIPARLEVDPLQVAAPAPITPPPPVKPVPLLPPTGLPVPVKCASEGGLCKFDGTKTILYGASLTKKNVKKQFTGQVACDNQSFGDPAWGTVKSCWVMPDEPVVTPPVAPPVVAPAPVPPTIVPVPVKCASEGGLCKFDGTKTILYGASLTAKNVKKQFTGQVACNNQNFGDPARFTVKSCWVMPD